MSRLPQHSNRSPCVTTVVHQNPGQEQERASAHQLCPCNSPVRAKVPWSVRSWFQSPWPAPPLPLQTETARHQPRKPGPGTVPLLPQRVSYTPPPCATCTVRAAYQAPYLPRTGRPLPWCMGRLPHPHGSSLRHQLAPRTWSPTPLLVRGRPPARTRTTSSGPTT